jgi:hypothetical protein
MYVREVMTIINHQTECPEPSSLLSQRHLPTFANCSGPQTMSSGLANKGDCEPTIRANMRGCEPTLTANEPTFIATSSQTAMGTHIRCIQSLET